MRACSGVWVAHGSGSADRETVGRARAACAVPPGEESYVLRRVWLTPEEEKGYYYGFSNEGLWPLCHIAHTRPIFRARRLAALPGGQPAVRRRGLRGGGLRRSDRPRPGLPLRARCPRMIRERLPRATVLTFWHIPWPNAERFGICPWRDELLAGLLGSSILGFHTQLHCNNFLDARRPLPRGAHRPRAERGRAAAAQRRWSAPTRSRSSGPARWLTGLPPGRRVPRERPRRARARAGRAARRRRRPPRLHQGDRGAAAGRRAAARAVPGRCAAASPSCSWRRPSRTRHRALPAAQRERRGAGRAHQRALRHRRVPPDRPPARRTTSRRPSSATTAPPTSAT